MKFQMGDKVSQITARDKVGTICDIWEGKELRRYRVQWEGRRTWISENRLVSCPSGIVS